MVPSRAIPSSRRMYRGPTRNAPSQLSQPLRFCRGPAEIQGTLRAGAIAVPAARMPSPPRTRGRQHTALGRCRERTTRASRAAGRGGARPRGDCALLSRAPTRTRSCSCTERAHRTAATAGAHFDARKQSERFVERAGAGRLDVVGRDRADGRARLRHRSLRRDNDLAEGVGWWGLRAGRGGHSTAGRGCRGRPSRVEPDG